MTRPSEPRIRPLDRADGTPAQRDLLDGSPAANVTATMVRHEALYPAWLAMGSTLIFKGRLRPRDRELIILRIAIATNSAYEWSQHVQLARGCGVTEEELRRLASAVDNGWSSDDEAMLAAVDELDRDSCVSDATWTRLASVLDDAQLIELLSLVGYYRMVAGILNSVGVQLDPGKPGLGELP